MTSTTVWRNKVASHGRDDAYGHTVTVLIRAVSTTGCLNFQMARGTGIEERGGEILYKEGMGGARLFPVAFGAFDPFRESLA